MSKRKIFIAAGTFALAISGFLATRANRKFAGTGSAYFRLSPSVVQTLFKGLSTAVPHLTTVNTGHTAFFKTSQGTTVTLFKSSNATTTLFYK